MAKSAKNKKKPVASAKKKPAAKKPLAKKAAVKKVAPAKGKAKAKPAAKKVVAKKVVAKKVVKKAAVKKPVIKKTPVKAVKPVVKKIMPVRKPTAVKNVTTKSRPSLQIEKDNQVKENVKKATANQLEKLGSGRSSVGLVREQSPKKHAREQILPEEANRLRYSDKELEEFREIIISKLEQSRRELNNLTNALTNANEHGTDDTAGTFKMLEDGSESLAKEEAGQLAQRQRKFIEQLENALVRIENKTYGICRVTGKLIPKERLRAVPHTTQSIEAKLNQYRD
jgi:RNA polymerase-binding transcription factor DksA